MGETAGPLLFVVLAIAAGVLLVLAVVVLVALIVFGGVTGLGVLAVSDWIRRANGRAAECEPDDSW